MPLHNIYKYIVAGAIVACMTPSAEAILPGQIRWHNEANDTLRITQILVDATAANLSTPGQRVEYIAKGFIGTPYLAHTLEAPAGEDEMLTINVDELDCTTFVETAAAFALTLGDYRTSWRDYANSLERIRYRSGALNGYASRLHYIADWVMDNMARGNVRDVTPNFPKVNYATKSIDFMSSHRDRYPALADDAQFERIKDIEMGFRNHRYPYIKTIDLGDKATKAAFRSGDIVALTSSLKDLDVTHMGIIVVRDGEPYLLHASSSHGKVEIADVPLAEFMKRNRSLTGVRVLRVVE